MSGNDRKPPSRQPAPAPASRTNPSTQPPRGAGGRAVSADPARDARAVSNEAARSLRDSLHQFQVPTTQPSSLPPAGAVDPKMALAIKKRGEKICAEARKISLSVPGDVVGPADIDARIDELRRMHAQVQVLEGNDKTALRDDIELDVTMYVQGKVAFAQAAQWYTLHPNPFLPGVMEALVGLSVPNAMVLQVRLPDVYPSPELRGQAAGLVIKLRRAHRLKKPAADAPAFLEGTQLGVKSLAELRNVVANELTKERGRGMVMHAQLMLLRELYARVGVDEPVEDALVEAELKRRFGARLGTAMGRLGSSLDEQRKSFADFCTPGMRAEARRTVWEQGALEAVAEANGVSVLDRDMAELVRMVAPTHTAEAARALLHEKRIDLEEAKAAYRLKRALYLLMGLCKVEFKASTSPTAAAPAPMRSSGSKQPSGGVMPASDPVTATRGLKRPPSKSQA
jgi:FKBP-type peptidyl-prolyl cis-trans isomerase (trigger factor)